MMVTVSGLRMRIERSGHLPMIEPGFEQGSSDSRALLLNLTLLCFPKLCCQAGVSHPWHSIWGQMTLGGGAVLRIVRYLTPTASPRQGDTPTFPDIKYPLGWAK